MLLLDVFAGIMMDYLVVMEFPMVLDFQQGQCVKSSEREVNSMIQQLAMPHK